MMEAILIVEGYTEEGLRAFFQPVINSKIINLKGAGNVFNSFRKAAIRVLRENADVFVICIIDYDEASKKYPPLGNDWDTRIHSRYIRKQMEEIIPQELRDRFKSFPVVYAIEAWLLADFIGLCEYLNSQSIQQHSSPEEIDNPKEKIKKEFRSVGKVYSERIDGTALLQQSQKLSRVYEGNCPLFCEIWDEIQSWDGQDFDVLRKERLIRLSKLRIELDDCNFELKKLLEKLNLKEKVLSEDEFESLAKQEIDLDNKREVLKAEITKLENIIGQE